MTATELVRTPYLREIPEEQTLSRIREDLAQVSGDRHEDVPLSAISVVLDAPLADRVITVGDDLRFPATDHALEALSAYLQVPAPFWKRIPEQLQQNVLNTLATAGGSDAARLELTEGTEAPRIMSVSSPGAKVYDPRGIVDIAARVIDPEAMVIEWWKNDQGFRLDAVVPSEAGFGIGGDAAVNDLTHGGLRFGVDLKHNLAPTVSELTYRLICTNGMQSPSLGNAIDARGQSVEEVMAELEAMAEVAFRRVEQNIDSFYELRGTPVENPERVIARVTEEHGIAPRVALRLVEEAASLEQPTMFDVVNMITNMANEPSIARRAGSRLILERAGGAIIQDHAARCGHCMSRLETR